jgi:hypothetical protein
MVTKLKKKLSILKKLTRVENRKNPKTMGETEKDVKEFSQSFDLSSLKNVFFQGQYNYHVT